MDTESEEFDDAGAGVGDAGAFANAAAARAGALAAQFDAWLALTGQARATADGPARLPMLSGSMQPSLPRGCTLLIEPAGAAAVAPGDVAVLARDGKLVAHRVLLRARRGGQAQVLEMGDANRRGTWRPAGDIVGRVIGAEMPEGHPLPAPGSKGRALRGLLRHWRAVWLKTAVEDNAT